MAKKGRYKKLLGGWRRKEERKEETRPKVKEEEREAAGEGTLPPRKKMKAESVPKANHRHIYEEVLVRTTDAKTGNRSYAIQGYCQICGKKDQRYRPCGFWKDRLWKAVYSGGLKAYTQRTEAEILEICKGMKILEIQKKER